ncbi:MAG: AAA family ATPase, partial [Candidatus Binataceae bacterium]
VLESLIGDLKFALGNGQARYQPPGNLSATEIADELDSIARGAMDEFLPPIVASAADLDAALPAVGEPVAIVINAALIKPEAVAWLSAGRIALGKLSLIVGDPGQGKSFITLDLAARLSSGRPWPDGAAGTESGDIIILSAEDSPADTIVPRLIASGADLSRVNILTAIKHGPTERQFSLQSDLPALEAAIKRTRVQLVIIDPLTAYLGGADSHKNSNMRAVLAPLSALAERYRLAVVAVSHLNKSETSALYRVTGSLAFVAAARAVYVVAPDRENPDRKIFARLKNNLAAVDQTSLAFSIAGNPPAVTWEPTGFAINLAELLAPDLLPPRRRGPDPEKRDTAEALIRQILCDGEKHPSAKVIDAARAAGIKYPTLDKAARGLGVERRKDGFDGGWTWRLCSELNPESSAQPLLSPINLGPSVTPLQEKGLDVDYDSESSEDSKNAGRRERHEL